MRRRRVGNDVGFIAGAGFQDKADSAGESLHRQQRAQIAKASGPGAKQYRVIVDRPAGATGDLGAVSVGIAGKTLSAVTMDAAPPRR